VCGLNSVHSIDVLVVGLGPAGARAAADAASAGASVLAVDRRKEAGFPVQCAELVPAMIDQELQGLEALTWQRIDAMLTFVESDDADYMPEFHGRMIDRQAFDRSLVLMAEQAGANCRFEAEVRSIDQYGEVTLSAGETIIPRLIIGADGPRSRVGRAIGSINTEIVETRQITVPLVKSQNTTDIYLSTEILGGYGWFFPKGGRANIGAGIVPSEKTKLKRIVEDLHQRLLDEGKVDAEIESYTGGAIPVGGLLKVSGTLGDKCAVLLAGDAAGLANPVTGAGIVPAVVSGSLAGEAAADFVKGDLAALQFYADDIHDLYKNSLDHAVQRRRKILNNAESNADDLRRGWIAFDSYWAKNKSITKTQKQEAQISL
jgi:geranylgeranyl reductase family protein